jgi:hypothetical protein
MWDNSTYYRIVIREKGTNPACQSRRHAGSELRIEPLRA